MFGLLAVSVGALAPAPVASSESVVDRTEKALVEQLRCERPPQAGIALEAMLRNGLVRPTGDAADGSVVFAPKRELRFLGFPIVHITGWQERRQGGAMPPFFRGPGTAPPNFIEITVRGSAADLKRAAAADGLGGTLSPSNGLFEIEDGDTDLAQKPLNGVATITCMLDVES